MSASTYVIAAMCGNFWTESNINPGIWESLDVGEWTSTGVGYGIGQWTNTGGNTNGRLYQLHEYLSNNGYADDSLEGQVAYITVENTWHLNTTAQKNTGYSSLTEFLNSTSTDLDALTKAWMLNWEGINSASLSARQEHAQTVYDYIVAHADDTSITTYYHSNKYLSESQILNNAVMLYRIMTGSSSGGTGGGGESGGGDEPSPTPTKSKHKMPIWMMVRYRRYV